MLQFGVCFMVAQNDVRDTLRPNPKNQTSLSVVVRCTFLKRNPVKNKTKQQMSRLADAV